MTPRSYLYVPGDNPSMLQRASKRGADALILDLEDAVALGSKDLARSQVARWVAESADNTKGEVWVRVNSGERLLEDVQAVCRPGLTGIVLPKATASAVEECAAVVDGAEITSGRVLLIALIESAVGLCDLRAVAEHPWVTRLALGEADLMADLGMRATLDAPELQSLRLDLVVASAAAGMASPIGPVFADFRDLAGLKLSTERLRRLGFSSRQAIHPAQVEVIHEVMTPSPEQVDRARRLLRRFRAATQEGRGVITDEDGRMVDEASIRLARQTVEHAPDDGE